MIEVRIESKRGCGFRKPGGLYLVAGGLSAPCGKLPIPLAVCPTCHAGWKPSRGWTWIDIDPVAQQRQCSLPLGSEVCAQCPVNGRQGKRVGLLWVGGKFYATPEDWNNEASRLGVSRRISQVPKDLVLGQTWVLMAHREAIALPCECGGNGGSDECDLCSGEGVVRSPGIFHAFRPRAIEYVVRGDESEEEIEAIRKRGITPVRVERAADSVT